MLSNSRLYFIYRVSLFTLALMTSFITFSQNVIPKPQQFLASTGSFAINTFTSISADDSFAREAAFLQKEISTLTNLHLPIIKQAGANGHHIILKKSAINKGPEGYRLTITPTVVEIEADESAGIFYGCISLLQMLPYKPNATTAGTVLPAIRIIDYPRFKWRGLMLDVSRTFMPVTYIKKTIDRMAFYKLNTLHLHLTDDQGWRIPLQSYPLLKEKATRFDSAYHEPTEFQGYYSTSDIKEIIAYAASLHVEIVPGIESPGHSHAALYAYPELSCTGNIEPVFPFFSGPGVTNDVFCVGNPGSIKFFEAAIKETSAQFPSKYFHLGGDEVPRTQWHHCSKCQTLVQSAGLQSTSELQGYFMQQLHDFVVKANKRPVAWDEILHDNPLLTKDWIVMSWTGSKPGWEAAAKGYDVVMTPTSHMYFDYDYNATNTKKIFNYDPLDGCADTSQISQHILGIQANFWSHIDRTESKVDYQLYPRLLALAERAWADAGNKDYEDFRRRRDYHRGWLELMGVKYYTGDFR